MPKKKVEPQAPEPKKPETPPSSNLHHKPTREELEANAQRALEEAEALKNAPPEDEEPQEDPIEDPTPEEPEEDPVVEDEEPEEDPQEDPTPEPTSLETELEKTKKKLRASSREGQILYQRNKQVNEAIEKAAEMPAPTEEDMLAEYGDDWETMSDFEKRMARESLTNSRRLNAITEVNKQFKELERWEKEVDAFMDDPANIAKNPALEGFEDEFKIYATKPTRRGVDFDILISSFLYQADQGRARTKKTQMFPKGTPGPSTKPQQKTDKIGLDEARVLRETNYPKYKEMLKAGKIQDDL